MNAITDLIGIGIYSIGEAAQLTELPSDRVRRWVAGTPHPARTEGAAVVSRRSSVIRRGLPDIEGRAALSFRELIEIRFIRHFLEAGLSWRVIRRAAAAARNELLAGDDRQLHYSTDGVSVFVDALAAEGERRARDPVNNQYVLLSVLRDSIKTEFDLEGAALIRAWRPRAATPLVLLDPRRSFGQPIVPDGIPTRALAQALTAEDGDRERVAALYETAVEAVRQAAVFEVKMRH